MIPHLLRMARLARNPPGWRAVRIGLAVFLAALLIWAVESAGLWPAWMTTERVRPPAVAGP